MKKRLITSALPYVNNIPHLGNLIQVLSADVFARFCRLRGYETLYVCGTDEYGTATETRALEEGKTPRALCDYYHAIHRDIYEWFNISFDKFGRTSSPQHSEITRQIFLDLDKNGYVKEQTSEQLFCSECGRFLADRYVRGICPRCGSADARGDQCESCGALLDPADLQNPRCSTCGKEPQMRSTTHLYIDLPAILPKYRRWMDETRVRGKWANNAVQMTQAWIRDGLRARAITRDLKWGVPVPKKGFEDKVFYVWFDAPIGYISITKCLTDETGGDWRDWWQNPDNVELFQFIGKDNIPFHTVIFPCSLIGSGQNWTKLYHMSSSEYLNYEDGKFSKSKGTGVFGSDAMESGVPADVWRFYIFYNRPERSDTLFVWKDFQEKINGELVGNLGNLINRTLTFVSRYYGGVIPAGTPDATLWDAARAKEKKITDLLEWAELKDAFHEIFALSSLANKAFQDAEPWKTRISQPEKAASALRDLCYIIRDILIMIYPYMPRFASDAAVFFGKKIGADGLSWKDIGVLDGLERVTKPEILARPLDDEQIAAYRQKYSGKTTERGGFKNERANEEEDIMQNEPEESADVIFNKNVALKTAKIIKIERHPNADKLYIETLDDGSGQERTIVSGLVPYFSEEELLGKSIIIADNLKPRKMRGVESRGMLLAAECADDEGRACIELLDSSGAAPGTPAALENDDALCAKPEVIDADTFFAAPMRVSDYTVGVNGKRLLINGAPVKTRKVRNGDVS